MLESQIAVHTNAESSGIGVPELPLKSRTPSLPRSASSDRSPNFSLEPNAESLAIKSEIERSYGKCSVWELATAFLVLLRLCLWLATYAMACDSV